MGMMGEGRGGRQSQAISPATQARGGAKDTAGVGSLAPVPPPPPPLAAVALETAVGGVGGGRRVRMEVLFPTPLTQTPPPKLNSTITAPPTANTLPLLVVELAFHAGTSRPTVVELILTVGKGGEMLLLPVETPLNLTHRVTVEGGREAGGLVGEDALLFPLIPASAAAAARVTITIFPATAVVGAIEVMEKVGVGGV